MSEVWKGSKGPINVSVEAFFDPATLSYWKRYVYQGSADAISGLESGLQDDGIKYDISNNGPVFTLRTELPFIDPSAQPVDRYEISTEATEIDIYQVEGVWNEVNDWDTHKTASQRTYKQQVEDMAANRTAPTLNVGVYQRFEMVVAHILGGVQHFPIDYTVLRRFRRVDAAYSVGSTGRLNLKDLKTIYPTHAQLNLPSNVAFVLPAIPSPTPGGQFGSVNFSSNYQWGWRVRSQNCVLQDGWVEQTYELLLAPHSLLSNSTTGADLIW